MDKEKESNTALEVFDIEQITLAAPAYERCRAVNGGDLEPLEAPLNQLADLVNCSRRGPNSY
jgi:hypothetical protein